MDPWLDEVGSVLHGICLLINHGLWQGFLITAMPQLLLKWGQRCRRSLAVKPMLASETATPPQKRREVLMACPPLPSHSSQTTPAAAFIALLKATSLYFHWGGIGSFRLKMEMVFEKIFVPLGDPLNGSLKPLKVLSRTKAFVSESAAYPGLVLGMKRKLLCLLGTYFLLRRSFNCTCPCSAFQRLYSLLPVSTCFQTTPSRHPVPWSFFSSHPSAESERRNPA